MAFYKKLSNNTLFGGGGRVTGPGFELRKEDKDTYTYPVHGWRWFDTRDDALAFFGIEEENNGAL